MIDIHCHIIPNVDDGAKSMQCTIEMAKMACEDGIRKIIATPHFFLGNYENDFKKIKEKTDSINHILKERKINLEIFPGQEIFLDNHLLELYREGTISTLNNKNYILLETDFINLPNYASNLIYELKILGIRTIIAHPERYLYIQKNIENLNPLIEEGCLFQLNAGSITGLYGKKAQRTSKLLIEKNLCDFVCSDAHGTGKRNPKLSKTYKYLKENYPSTYERILKNSQSVIEGSDIWTEHHTIKKKKGFWAIFKK